MTQTAAIAYSFLAGESNSIMTAFKKFYCTNLPREVGRSIERKFGVKIHRVAVKFTSTYGRVGEYYRYTLLKTSENFDGIKRMTQYVIKEIGNPKTDQEQKMINKIKPLLNL